jgi:hypothetical protein
MASIVVAGGVLRRPTGSNLAAHLHYLIGLRKLGHQVIYLEERGEIGPGEPAGAAVSGVPRAGIVLLRELLRRCRVDVPVVWVDQDAGLVGGMVWAQLRKRLAKADLLLDLGGHCWLAERSLPRRRALVDLRSGPGLLPVGRQTDHDLYFSYRRDPASLPGVDWQATIPPVVPRLWYGPRTRADLPLRVLTGLERRSSGPQCVGPDGRDIEGLLALPGRIVPRPWMTLPAERQDLARPLTEAGWAVREDVAVDASLSTYRGHLIGSQAALALRGTEAARGIWFAAEDACFLAAGRPILSEDRTLDSWLPTGSGIVTFEGLDGAVDAVARLQLDLPRHAAAARGIAEGVFHYRVVLPSLLDQALSGRLKAAAAA